MKKTFIMIALIGLFGCKSKLEKVRDYDMTTFCKNYRVLVTPVNELFYVLISRNDHRERFIIYKDMNDMETGYGFCYGQNDVRQDVLKGGVYESAEEAVEKGKKNYEINGACLWLTQLYTFDNKKWVAYDRKMQELCPQ